MFHSGTRRAVSGLKSAGAVVSNPGARRRAAGALVVSAQNHHLSRESGRLRRLLRKAPRWTGSWASNAHGHTGLNGLGPQNHRHLIWAGRGLDKIDDIKDSDGAWRTSRGCVGSKQPLEATGTVG